MTATEAPPRKVTLKWIDAPDGLFGWFAFFPEDGQLPLEHRYHSAGLSEAVDYVEQGKCGSWYWDVVGKTLKGTEGQRPGDVKLSKTKP